MTPRPAEVQEYADEYKERLEEIEETLYIGITEPVSDEFEKAVNRAMVEAFFLGMVAHADAVSKALTEAWTKPL